jgi:hypothetical protein
LFYFWGFSLKGQMGNASFWYFVFVCGEYNIFWIFLAGCKRALTIVVIIFEMSKKLSCFDDYTTL